MPRFDKYEPEGGGFRAKIAADFPDADLGKAIGVSLDATGRVVRGNGNVGAVAGVMVLTSRTRAGDVVDVMTDGEIVEMTGTVAGTTYFAAAADGVISTTNTGTRLGHTVEADRLIVRVAR